MSKDPHGKLDPHVAIRDPGSLPKLVRSGMYNLIRQETRNDPTPDLFIKAFNIITWSLLTAGPKRDGTDARLDTVGGDPSRVRLTNKGKAVEREMLKAGRQPRLKSKKKTGSKTKKKRVTTRKTAERIRFEQKDAQLKRWAEGIYEDDPDYYTQNWWKATVSRG